MSGAALRRAAAAGNFARSAAAAGVIGAGGAAAARREVLTKGKKLAKITERTYKTFFGLNFLAVSQLCTISTATATCID